MHLNTKKAIGKLVVAALFFACGGFSMNYSRTATTMGPASLSWPCVVGTVVKAEFHSRSRNSSDAPSLRESNLNKEFGVISSFCDETNKRQCEVKASLRQPSEEPILTLAYKIKHYGSSDSAFVDFDTEGISGLERMIQRLKEQNIWK